MARLSLWDDHAGAVFAEFAILLPLIVTVVCGSIDFLYAFYQWNAAAKAVEVGARIAAVSDPVAPGLNNMSNEAILNGAMPGDPMPSFTVTCKSGACACVGTCNGFLEDSFEFSGHEPHRVRTWKYGLRRHGFVLYNRHVRCALIDHARECRHSVQANRPRVCWKARRTRSDHHRVAAECEISVLFFERSFGHTYCDACNDNDHHGRTPMLRRAKRILRVVSNVESCDACFSATGRL